jgi:hypothetical protein
VVLARLEADALRGGSGAAAPSPTADELSSRARLLVLVGIATMRHAWACWADSSEQESFPTQLDASFRELKSLF